MNLNIYIDIYSLSKLWLRSQRRFHLSDQQVRFQRGLENMK